jgi:hypothetical protein
MTMTLVTATASTGEFMHFVSNGWCYFLLVFGARSCSKYIKKKDVGREQLAAY